MTLKLAIPASFLILLLALPADAALIDRVNEAFRSVYGRNPNVSEWTYWAGRVQRKEKTSFAALAGAMGYQKAQNSSSPTATTITTLSSSAASVGGFVTDRAFYPSVHNPNFLPEGTLITSPNTPNIYYVRDGKKSWVHPTILARWFNENHFFKGNIVINISDADLARYPTASSVNQLYVGKVLQHPTGAQFFIDDKFRKRPLSASVRSALRIPAGNLYPVSAAHLSEFRTGPAVSASKLPGGFVMYDGPYHGGRLWKTEEIAGGTIVKRLYLKDRFYEADGNPDESHRAPIDAGLLAKHPRGANIDRYPDGWVISIGSNIYVMQGGARRLVASADVFAAMGYRNEIHVRGEFPTIYSKYAQGHPIRAFKGITSAGAAPTKGAPAPAPSTASHLNKVRPGIRTLIAQVNDHFRFIFDRDPSISENKFWVDYLYNGEVNTKADLIESMRRAKTTGKNPSRTSRTAVLSEQVLENHWFPYLFYFVHQKEPNDDDRSYWFGRINGSDRNTIEKLGGTLQWVKDNYNGATHR